MSDLPAKTVSELTDAELATVIQEREHSSDSAAQSIVQSCWREIERRNGITGIDY